METRSRLVPHSPSFLSGGAPPPPPPPSPLFGRLGNHHRQTNGRWIDGPRAPSGGAIPAVTPDTWADKFESFERINSIRETNESFDSCNSSKRLVPSRLPELSESKFPLVSRIEFIRSKLSNLSAHVSGVGLPAACTALAPPLPLPSHIIPSRYEYVPYLATYLRRSTAGRPARLASQLIAAGLWRHTVRRTGSLYCSVVITVWPRLAATGPPIQHFGIQNFDGQRRKVSDKFGKVSNKFGQPFNSEIMPLKMQCLLSNLWEMWVCNLHPSTCVQ